jgi:uncharacterized protein YaiL (DUF2058 family)
MSESLKDQLIALGLAREKPVKSGKRGGGNKPRRRTGDVPLEQAYLLRDKAEQQHAQAKKQKKREEDLLRRQLNAQIQTLVEAHALNDRNAELKRNFMYKGRIRSVLVTAEQLNALNAGDLGVVFLRGGYYVMAPEHVEAVRSLSAEHVPDLGAGQADGDEEVPVPDDLVW